MFGIDIHPVSVQIARVTFLLALGQERLQARPAYMTIPVYMGDSLQWNTSGFLADREVLIEVPDGGELLEFPFEVARDPEVFDAVIGRMLDLSKQQAPSSGLTAWLAHIYNLAPPTIERLAETYQTLRRLHIDGRDHIWGFVARNLVRPVWLAQEDQRADVLIGNPPWLAYRNMRHDTQQRFRDECRRRGLWAGGKVATHQDISAYFFVRCVELYLKPTGLIGFIMPYAAMTRRQFDGFRTGVYATRRGTRVEEVFATLQFTMAWALSNEVQPLFPVPSCVLFGRVGGGGGGVLPATVLAATGDLPQRDTSSDEAEEKITWIEVPWPPTASYEAPVSPYRDRFHQGATIVPRMLSIVDFVPAGMLGANPATPLLRSRRTNQEKPPWKHLPGLRGNVEKEFLRPLYLGESVAPFRVLDPVTAVIPWDSKLGRLVDAGTAQQSGYLHLAHWLNSAEQMWTQHTRADITFIAQVDYYGKLTAQFPIAPLRVVYTKAGTLPAATLLADPEALIDHKLYWATASSEAEGRYLLGVLNSETARRLAEHLQSRGQWGARDFDKVLLSLPIPQFDESKTLHRQLAEAAAHAEKVASAVPLREGIHFVRARQLIRAALAEDGVAGQIDALVEKLLAEGAASQ